MVSKGSGEPATSIDIQGIPIAYETRGSGTPIILVHGWSADRNYMLADLEPVFADCPGWKRVYLDLPGHGATPAPEWLSTQDQMLSIVQSFVEALIPQGPYAIAGSSYGAHITLGIVRSNPDRICGAALLIPDVPAPDGTRETETPVTVYEDREAFPNLDSDEEWIPAALVVHERRMLDEIRRHDMPAYRKADYAFLDRLASNYLPEERAGATTSAFTGPSLILCGRQDATVGFRSAWSLVDEFPRATYAVLDLAGHHLGRIERPMVFNALVTDWIQRITLQLGQAD